MNFLANTGNEVDNENQSETGFSFSVNANSIHELRDVLMDAAQLVTEMFYTANEAVHDFDKAQREKAFIRYCNTGKFD